MQKQTNKKTLTSMQFIFTVRIFHKFLNSFCMNGFQYFFIKINLSVNCTFHQCFDVCSNIAMSARHPDIIHTFLLWRLKCLLSKQTWQALSPAVPAPASPVGVPWFGPWMCPSFLLMQTMDPSGDDSSTWVHATSVGALAWAPGSPLWTHSAWLWQAFEKSASWNEHSGVSLLPLSMSSCLSHSLSLPPK